MRRVLRAVLVAALTLPALIGTHSDASATGDPLFPEVSDCSSFSWFNDSWRRLGRNIAYAATRWVPQGLAYDGARDWLLMSYYDRFEDERSILVVYNRRTAGHVKTLWFSTRDVQRGGHVGGLAVGRGSLYVTNTRSGRANVHRIALSTIARAGNGDTLPNAPSYTLAASSYASFHNGSLFVGSFSGNRVYRYRTTPAGTPRMNTRVAYPTPSYVQGLAVTNHRFVFSRSYGRDRVSYLTVVNRSTWSQHTRRIRNMSEGITWGPARYRGNAADVPSLYAVFESTSDEYADSSCRTHRMWKTRRSMVP